MKRGQLCAAEADLREAMALRPDLPEIGFNLASAVQDQGRLEEALALLDQPLDAAVLDANLNGHSVIPVAQVLHDRGIPFVFATGYGEAGGAPGGWWDGWRARPRFRRKPCCPRRH